MIAKEDVEKWTAIAAPIITFFIVTWHKIRAIDLKTDGMLKWRSRAEIAEAKLEEKDAQRDIVEHHRQEDRKDRKQ
jgi:hypothetical protein